MAEIYGSMKEIAVHMAKTQQEQVDALTEEAPVLGSIPFEKATHELWNVAPVITSIKGGGVVDANAPLPMMSVGRGLKRVDLQVIGGEVFVPQDAALAMGGRAAYFAKNEPLLMKQLGMDVDVSIIYNMLRQYAIDNGKYTKVGGTANANYSVIAVNWEPGNVCGLYSPLMFKKDTFFQEEALYGGALMKNGDGVAGYGMQYKSYMGVQLLNPKRVSALVNIDATHKPTAMQVDDFLAACRARPNTTKIYCHPKAMSIMADVGKSSAFRMGPGDKDVDREIERWNKIPFVTDYNFYDGTEANVA